jgi:hypothetical protein
MVNRALPQERRDDGVLAESRLPTQGENMSARMTFLAAVILIASGGVAAAQSCGTQINEFRDIVKTETSMGHVSGNSQSAALAELARIESTCRSGRNAEALAALHALQRRMKFR